MSAGRKALFIIGGVLFVVLLIGGPFAWRWITAEPKGALEAREQTLGDGDFRLQAYDYFFGLCGTVQSQEDRIDALNQELATNPSQGRVEQINASLTAVRAGRSEAINEYNNASTGEYTRGQFRDSDLPYQLDQNDEDTECVIVDG